ncbi:MAG: DUF2240 family protein [Candidatus Methanomethylophilaceae archaeon]|nr:DUF2240 family protein [Candidatus Methanomethylophilaceae archaeon]
MADETQVCAAAFFRACGKDVVTVDEFVMGASLELKWLPPSKAKALLSLLENEGAVTCKKGYVRLAENIEDTDLPMAYRPSPELLSRLSQPLEPKKPAPEPEAKDAFHVLMEAAEKAGMKKTDFIQSSNRVQKRLDIDIGAAALIVLRDDGVDISPYADMVYSSIRGS